MPAQTTPLHNTNTTHTASFSFQSQQSNTNTQASQPIQTTDNKPVPHSSASSTKPTHCPRHKQTHKPRSFYTIKYHPTIQHLKQKVNVLVKTVFKASKLLRSHTDQIQKLRQENTRLRSGLSKLKQTQTVIPPPPHHTASSSDRPTSTLTAFSTFNRFSTLHQVSEDEEQDVHTDTVTDTSTDTDTDTDTDRNQTAPNAQTPTPQVPLPHDKSSNTYNTVTDKDTNTQDWKTVHPRNRKTTQSRSQVQNTAQDNRNSSDNNTTASPRQLLSTLRVDPNIPNVIIGDSVMRNIQPDLVFPKGRSQTISIPGLTVDDLIHWLKHIPRNTTTQRIVLHIGINTCKHTAITANMWTQLIRTMKHVFPQARLLLSSILPPMGQHPLKKTVHLSNLSLATVCVREHLPLADHTSLFLARSGAPRKDLYHDSLHPSSKGSDRLTCSLRNADPSHRRPALLRTPTAQPCAQRRMPSADNPVPAVQEECRGEISFPRYSPPQPPSDLHPAHWPMGPPSAWSKGWVYPHLPPPATRRPLSQFLPPPYRAAPYTRPSSSCPRVAMVPHSLYVLETQV